MSKALRTNKYGVEYGKGEVWGLGDKWIATCKIHNTIVSDTTLKGIRTMSQQDFCDCCRNICLENIFEDVCGNCGATNVAVVC